MLVVLAEGHLLLAGEPGVKFLVGPDQAGLVGGHKDGPELVDDLVGEGRIGGNLGITARNSLFPSQRSVTADRPG